MIKRSCFSTIVEENERIKLFEKSRGENFIRKNYVGIYPYSTAPIRYDSSVVPNNNHFAYAMATGTVLCGYTSTSVNFNRDSIDSFPVVGFTNKGIKNMDLPSNTKGLNNGRDK